MLLLLLDLRHQSPNRLLGELASRLDAGLVVGLAASPLPASGAVVWVDDQIVSGATLGILLRGAASTHWGVASDCRALTGLHTVTRARDRWISSFDGRPAIEVLRQVAEQARLPASALSLRQLMLEVNGPSPGTSGSGQRSRLCNIVGVDPRRNAILLPDEIQAGTRVRFALRDAVAARENLESVVAEHIVPECALGLYVSGNSLDYAGPQGTARDARCFEAHDSSVSVLGLRGSQVLGPLGGLGTDCAALNACGLLVVLER